MKTKGKQDREKLKTENPQLFKAISDCLFKYDPIGINFKTNTNEYEPEVGTIMPQLADCTSEEEVLHMVYKEFCLWFGPDTAGKIEDFQQISMDIWRLWQQTNKDKA